MVTIKDIQTAYQRTKDVLHPTPLARAHGAPLSKVHLHLKLENMQQTGSFKERGALYKLLLLKDEGGCKGVVAGSAGNHAQAVSCHSARLGLSSVIVMPEETPLTKVTATRRWGAEIELKGHTFHDVVDRAKEISTEKGLAFIHAFDDPAVIAGQGTLGLELLQQLSDIDCVVMPVGGGGLASGVATALKSKKPKCKIIGVQTTAFPFMVDAWKGKSSTAGTNKLGSTIADGIAVKVIGEKTLPILKKYVDDMVTVTEEEISNAILHLLENSKILVEGAGAAGMAAILSKKVTPKGNTVAVISGGNIDVNLISRIIEKGLVKSGRLLCLNVVIPDRPGGLKALAGLFADLRANVLQIHHERTSRNIPLYTTGTELTLETKGPKHAQEVVRNLKKHGYEVEIKD